MSHILVVDDEPAIGWSLRGLLDDEGHEVEVAASVDEALGVCRRFTPETVLLDVRLPGRDGISAIPDLQVAAPGAPVIVMTAFGDLDTAVRAVRAGAFDYLVKPFDLDHVAAVVGRALAERAGAARASDAPAAPSATIVGRTAAMQEVYKKIALAAAADVPVLVTGAPGTGKGLAARAIHAAGPRRDGPFVTTSLAALAPTAVEGELFGRAGGGPGLVERAHGGTLVVEHVDEASAAVQARLLDVLDHGEIRGGDLGTARRVDVRVIATAEHDPAHGSARPIQRELADRLRAFTIAMPSLAQRRDDIEPLARSFAAATARGAAAVVSPEFLRALAGRDWPGNVRELRAAVEHAAVVAHGGTLRPEHLPAPPERLTRGGLDDAAHGVGAAVKEWAATARAAFGNLPEPDLHHRALKLVEATLLREALAHAGGNRTAAAKLLGLDRATLRTKLRSLGLDD
jgi:DNA-binding NtrC family response regulator